MDKHGSLTPRKEGGNPHQLSLAYSSECTQRLLIPAAVDGMWHAEDSQGRIMAWAFKLKSLKPFYFFPLRSAAASRTTMRACAGC
jgi:hypothetical protein